MKKNHWRDWLEKATDPDLWTAHNYVSAPPGDCRKTRYCSPCLADAYVIDRPADA